MTAYVNEEKKEGAYGKAVKATLAATLAAGMIPAAAAFADEPAETASEGDIELFSLSPEKAFENGTVSAAKDNEGNVVADLSKVSFAADGKAHFIVPTEFAPEGGAAIDVTDASKYTVKYYAVDKDGKKTGSAIAADTIVKPGSYGVTVTDKANGIESQVAAVFTIGSASLKDATLVEGSDVKDTEFVYTGAKMDLGLALNGEMLASTDDYTVEYHAKGSSAIIAADDLKNAGDYVAVVKGADDSIYKGQKVEIAFSIAKLDLSKAEVKLGALPAKPAEGAAMTIDSIAGFTGAVNDVAIAKIVSVPTTIYGAGQGVYEVEIAAVADNANVSGKQTVEVVKTLKTDAKVLYDGKPVADIDTDYSAEEPVVFDAKKLAAYTAGDEAIKDAKVDIVVRNAEGEIVENADPTKPGVWHIEATVNAASTNYEYSGPAVNFTVTVKDGSVDTDADVIVTYDGAVTAGETFDYTGEDFLEKVAVVVKSGDKTLVEGKDYNVALTKEVKGEDVAVDAMVDAGNYKLAISSKNYPFNDEVAFTVTPAAADTLRIDPATTLLGDGETFAYTGEAIVPAIQYQVEGDVYGNLPADAYKLVIENEKGDKVDEIKEVGSYKVTVKDAGEDNYAVTETVLNASVSNDKIYSDVAPSDWFYEYVYNAQQAGYMFGIGNSDIFAPHQTTSRAMAAQVLARMAGATDGQDTSMSFSDVASDAWYADAVAWAATAGVVNGYPGTDEFRPENNVTRAEFCIMMKNYADATGQGKALAEGEADEILAKYADGASVPEWCKAEVAWAVKNEIFGGYSVLNPQGDITRAEMAKMAVAFQAEPLK